jgi:hypothetical protein
MNGGYRINWNLIAMLVFVLILMFVAFSLGKTVGRLPDEYEQEAISSLRHALDTIDAFDASGESDEICETLDSLLDDIRDAVAWMEKSE